MVFWGINPENVLHVQFTFLQTYTGTFELLSHIPME